jgi:diguanylate cyclase (GGDEF)-like protein/PAS domain S-box-containing protein
MDMKLINALQSKPAVLLILMIVVVCICIIGIVVVLIFRLENEKRVTKAAIELRRITNSIGAGLVHFTLEEDGRILYASNGFYELLGYEKNTAKAENKLTLLDFIDSRDAHILEDIKTQIDQDFIRCDVRMITKDGNVLHLLMNGNSAVGKDGRHTLSVVFLDMTEQKRMQELILLEGERYRIATELSKDVLFEYHIQTDVMILSEKFRELFGHNSLIQNFCNDSNLRRSNIHPDDWGIYLELCGELSEGKSIIEAEFRIKDRLGEFIWCQLKGKTIYDDDKVPVRVIGKLVNIDTQKRELEALEYKATRDPLTGVYNKEITIKKIDKFIAGNKNSMHMLMFIDFDDFKHINDTYGHLQGDKVLTYAIGRIKEIFSEGEIIGRIGGDEFVVFVGNMINVEDVLAKANKLTEALNTTYAFDHYNIPISGSIGVAIYPEAGLHYEQLINRADKALYRVKEQGKKNFMLYSTELKEDEIQS